MPADRGRQRRTTGDRAEIQALRHLQQAGLELLHANARAGHGELDLVMRDASRADRPVLVFVEVRHRDSNAFGGAAASVDTRKQARLIRAAEAYLALHPEHAGLPCRFDVVCSHGPDFTLQWVRDAFQTP